MATYLILHAKQNGNLRQALIEFEEFKEGKNKNGYTAADYFDGVVQDAMIAGEIQVTGESHLMALIYQGDD